MTPADYVTVIFTDVHASMAPMFPTSWKELVSPVYLVNASCHVNV